MNIPAINKFLNNPALPGMLLFFAALFIGLDIYQDYGVAWDEPIQRDLAKMSYDYVTLVNHNLVDDVNRFYGMGFELPLIYLEKWMGLSDSRDIYLMRHLVTHIFFLLSLLCFYFLVLRLFKNRFLACLGFLILLTAPRLYAHSFFNSKDLPFLSMSVIILSVAQLAFEKNKSYWYFLTGVVCGYTTSIRIMGIMAGVFILSFLVIDMVIAFSKKGKPLKSIFNLFLFTLGFCLMLYAAWPVLWTSPIKNFVEGYQVMSHYNWGGYLLFKGEKIPCNNLPWDYFPTWFLISNPELWLLAGLGGVIWLIVVIIKKPLYFLKNTPGRNFAFYLLSFFIPVIAIVILHAVIYDDWRHLYFVYPPFVLLGLYFIDKLLKLKFAWITKTICLVQLALTFTFMVKAHPFEQVYFNNLVSHKKNYLLKNYELEYWGCGYKQALECLIATENKPVINIAWTMNPLMNNLLILQKRDRKRIDMVEKNPDYIITTYRGVNFGQYDSLNCVFSINVLNSPVLGVYKLH